MASGDNYRGSVLSVDPMPDQTMKALPNVIPSNILWIQAALLVVLSLLPERASAQGYLDVAPSQGLDFLIPSQPMPFGSEVGSGVSFFDFDGDGWDDLTFCNTNDSLIFYRNVDGVLQRMPSLLFGAGQVKQVLWVDLDNDGDKDLFITTYNGPLRLLRNDGDWNFTDISADSGLEQGNAKHFGASFGDFDRDGFLDLYVCTFIHVPGLFQLNRLNRLYRNNGDGTFTDVTLSAGVGNGQKASFQSVWIDIDLDGWPDLYVINDFMPGNALYRNNGDGTFTDMAQEMGLLLAQEHPMSISVADFDNDGDLDIFMSNTGIFPHVNSARSLLMVNNGDGTFTEASGALGLDIFEWGWGGLWVDHDNDGYLDLYVATHREFGPPVANQFHSNNGGTSFTNAATLFPSPQITESHAVARGDLDRDGHADIVVQNQAPFRPYLWKNTGGGGTYIRVTVEGTASNRQAVGTWIRVFAAGQQYVHYTLCGENYLGQSSQHILFGLGAAAVVDSVVVEYLSGHVDRYYELPVDAEYHFVEGDTYGLAVSPLGPTSFCMPDSVVLDAGDHNSYLWNTGDSTRYITADSTGSYWVAIGTSTGLQLTSDPVEVVVYTPPVVFATHTNPACAGDKTGSIVLSNLLEVDLESVVWDHGPMGDSLNGSGAGVYAYTMVDVNGCSSSGTVELFDPDPLFVFIEMEPEVEGGDGAIGWSIFGGTPPYVVELAGEEMSGASAVGLVAGEYPLLVSDAEGCTFLKIVEVAGAVGMVQVARRSLVVHPNPVAHELWVRAPDPVLAWAVLDGSGRVVMRHAKGPLDTPLSMASLAAGTYALEVYTTTGERYLARFVKQP